MGKEECQGGWVDWGGSFEGVIVPRPMKEGQVHGQLLSGQLESGSALSRQVSSPPESQSSHLTNGSRAPFSQAILGDWWTMSLKLKDTGKHYSALVV